MKSCCHLIFQMFNFYSLLILCFVFGVPGEAGVLQLLHPKTGELTPAALQPVSFCTISSTNAAIYCPRCIDLTADQFTQIWSDCKSAPNEICPSDVECPQGVTCSPELFEDVNSMKCKVLCSDKNVADCAPSNPELRAPAAIAAAPLAEIEPSGVEWTHIVSQSYLTAPRAGSSLPSKNNSGYVYTFPAWGPCSHTCEIVMGKQVNGIQTRTPLCTSVTGAPAPLWACGALQVGYVAQACSSENCKGTLQYEYSDWTMCTTAPLGGSATQARIPVTCGGGTMTRTASCVERALSGEVLKVVDVVRSSADAKGSACGERVPPLLLEKRCATAPCGVGPIQAVGEWSMCSIVGGLCIKRRVISCQANGVIVPATNCIGQAQVAKISTCPDTSCDSTSSTPSSSSAGRSLQQSLTHKPPHISEAATDRAVPGSRKRRRRHSTTTPPPTKQHRFAVLDRPWKRPRAAAPLPVRVGSSTPADNRALQAFRRLLQEGNNNNTTTNTTVSNNSTSLTTCPIEFTCSGVGTCTMDNTTAMPKCSCDIGFSGPDCQYGENAECTVGLWNTASASCCNSGVFSLAQECCGAGQTLSSDGLCCPVDYLDECGGCGGSSLRADAIGNCCQSHAVDARGLCCESESIDSCGVCDGDHSSCDTVIHVDVMFSDPVEKQAVEASVLEHVSSTLAIPAGDTPLDTSTRAVVLSLNAGGTSAMVALYWQGVTLDATGAFLKFNALLAYPANPPTNLPDSAGRDSARGTSVSSMRVLEASKQAKCGNDVCEFGEAVETGATAPGASGLCSVAGTSPTECPIEFARCPILTVSDVSSSSLRAQGPGAGNLVCSGRGSCLSGLGGTCSCNMGWSGDACDLCAPGFFEHNGLCIAHLPTRRSLILDLLRQGEPLMLAEEAPSPPPAPPGKTTISSLVLIAIIGACILGVMSCIFGALAISGGFCCKDKHNFPPRNPHGDVVSPTASLRSAASRMSGASVMTESHVNPKRLGTIFGTGAPGQIVMDRAASKGMPPQWFNPVYQQQNFDSRPTYVNAPGTHTGGGVTYGNPQGTFVQGPSGNIELRSS